MQASVLESLLAALCDLFFYFDWLSIVVDAKHLSLVMNTACFQVNKEFTTSCEGKITPLTIALFIKYAHGKCE